MCYQLCFSQLNFSRFRIILYAQSANALFSVIDCERKCTAIDLCMIKKNFLRNKGAALSYTDRGATNLSYTTTTDGFTL